MTPPSTISPCGAATVFVAQDVLRRVEYYRMRDFDIHDLDGNQLCFGMESRQPGAQ